MASNPLPRPEAQRLLAQLVSGKPPDPPHALDLLVDYERAFSSWTADLAGYVREGGSLLRILSAPIGEGKTHLARALEAQAARQGYLICHIDAAGHGTDDDLSLYRAICARLTLPGAVLNRGVPGGLLGLLEDVADRLEAGEVRHRLQEAAPPVAALKDALPMVVAALQERLEPEARRERLSSVIAATSLLSGEPVSGTRSIAALRRKYPSPPITRLNRAPGKRDARLWLESLLRLLPALGFPGIFIVLDEHDEESYSRLDRHIVQIRRLTDRLTEGHLPSVFALYFVLEDFPERVAKQHAALSQRLNPVIDGDIPDRVMSPLRELRTLRARDFLEAIGTRLYGLVGNGSMPGPVAEACRQEARLSLRMGEPRTREFTQRFASYLLDREV